jgi:hypothetical protein
MPTPDLSKKPLSAQELAAEAEGKDQPVLHPRDAKGHSLPASESGPDEPECREEEVVAITQMPPD